MCFDDIRRTFSGNFSSLWYDHNLLNNRSTLWSLALIVRRSDIMYDMRSWMLSLFSKIWSQVIPSNELLFGCIAQLLWRCGYGATLVAQVDDRGVGTLSSHALVADHSRRSEPPMDRVWAVSVLPGFLTAEVDIGSKREDALARF